MSLMIIEAASSEKNPVRKVDVFRQIIEQPVSPTEPLAIYTMDWVRQKGCLTFDTDGMITVLGSTPLECPVGQLIYLAPDADCQFVNTGGTIQAVKEYVLTRLGVTYPSAVLKFVKGTIFNPDEPILWAIPGRFVSFHEATFTE